MCEPHWAGKSPSDNRGCATSHTKPLAHLSPARSSQKSWRQVTRGPSEDQMLPLTHNAGPLLGLIFQSGRRQPPFWLRFFFLTFKALVLNCGPCTHLDWPLWFSVEAATLGSVQVNQFCELGLSSRRIRKVATKFKCPLVHPESYSVLQDQQGF